MDHLSNIRKIYKSLQVSMFFDDFNWLYYIIQRYQTDNKLFYLAGTNGYRYRVDNELDRYRIFKVFFCDISVFDMIGYNSGTMSPDESDMYAARLSYFIKLYWPGTGKLYQMVQACDAVGFLALAPFITYECAAEATQCICHLIYHDEGYASFLLNNKWGEEQAYFPDSFLPADIKSSIRAIVASEQRHEEVDIYAGFEACIYYTVRMMLLACKKLGGKMLVVYGKMMFDYTPPTEYRWVGVCSLALREFIASGMDTGIDFFTKQWHMRKINMAEMYTMVRFQHMDSRYGYYEDLLVPDNDEHNAPVLIEFSNICATAAGYYKGNIPFVSTCSDGDKLIRRVMSRADVKVIM